MSAGAVPAIGFPSGAELVLEGISKRYGSTVALKPLTLTIPGGSLVALLGPSGCGKTTTLRIVAGFERPDRGRVRVGGRDITGLPPNKRGLGMVFQNYSLFPHMTVAENIAFGLKMAGMPRAEISNRVAAALDTVRLAGFGGRYTHQLSGGQQQRVALARSIITNPTVLLLDEPLGALDKNLRESMQFELHSLQRSLGITSVLVTHDQEEALTMSDLVAVMRDGEVVQMGPPGEVYDRPRTRFVAEFLGTSNILDATVSRAEPGGIVTQGSGYVLRAGGGAGHAVGERVMASIRPEKVNLARDGAHGENAIAGRIVGHVFRGTYHAFQIESEGIAQRLFAYVPPRAIAAEGLPDLGTAVTASWRAEDVVLLSE
jgi:spermidine/putrescine ABC transporter ATP-binding subunit